jgi:hypothetical protein
MKTINNLPKKINVSQRPKNRIFSLLSIAVFSASTLSLVSPSVNADDDSYAIGLWGDLAYSDEQANVGIPNLIADMNTQRLAFTVHDGDLKAGNGISGSTTPTTCEDALYTQWLGFFNSLRAPAMFTPGDNDWVDCDRPKNGGFSSLERLDHERKVFFNTPYSLGQYRIRQEVQIDPLCLGANGDKVPCLENRRWTIGKVTYATLNVQGSCNNLCDTNPDPAEFNARNAANIQWLNETFKKAKARQSVAVMLISQANPGWDLNDVNRSPLRNPVTLAETDSLPDGYLDFLLALRNNVIDFKKPVAYVHGDSHYFRVDKPLLNDRGQRLENFTRVETFGDNAGNGTNDVQWLKVLVDGRSREVFWYQPQIIPGNRVAVPAP